VAEFLPEMPLGVDRMPEQQILIPVEFSGGDLSELRRIELLHLN
jgi:hypothetical protein